MRFNPAWPNPHVAGFAYCAAGSLLVELAGPLLALRAKGKLLRQGLTNEQELPLPPDLPLASPGRAGGRAGGREGARARSLVQACRRRRHVSSMQIRALRVQGPCTLLRRLIWEQTGRAAFLSGATCISSSADECK